MNEKEKSYVFPRFLSYPLTLSEPDRIGGIVSITGFLSGNRFIDNKGYVDPETDIVWIYRKDPPKINRNKYPYFWKKDEDLVFSSPSEEMKERFSYTHAVSLDLDKILKETKDSDKMYNEAAILEMNSSSAKYSPIINPKDDFLKMVVKQVILEKNIDINRLKIKMDNTYNLLNMKQALEKDTKMSVNYFVKWAEILGFDFTITCVDNGEDSMDPLKLMIKYESKTGKVEAREMNDFNHF